MDDPHSALPTYRRRVLLARNFITRSGSRIRQQRPPEERGKTQENGEAKPASSISTKEHFPHHGQP